ncbi:MAG: pseudaminic acid biosynthesis-associated methylase [Gemmatimonadota bacterium]
MTTPELQVWTSEFGRAYTDRNTLSVEDMDQAFAAQFGVAKTVIYRELVGAARLPAGRVLEVGCNIGLQLRLLERVNPGLEFHGLEPQPYAVKQARELSPNMTFHDGTAFALPFEDRSFDLVMTHGVLIHINPKDLPRALAEIHRVSRRFVLCHEYYAERPTEIRYHDRDGLLWKRNFGQAYLDQFADLRAVAVKLYAYAPEYGGPGLVDQVMLLEREGAR